MKQTPKEKLNDKARKMIDLIYDEVVNGGEKEISSSFIDPKTSFQCVLSVKINIVGPEEENNIEVPDFLNDMG